MQMITSAKLNGRRLIEEVTGEIPDISEYVDFDFYYIVWYHTGMYPTVSKEHQALGRRMGVAHRIVRDMPYWIMPISGQPIAKTTVKNVTRDDMLDPDIAAHIKAFDWSLTELFGDTNFIIDDFGGFGVED